MVLLQELLHLGRTYREGLGMPCMPWKVVLEVGFCIGFLARNGVRRVVPSATGPDAWISFTERIIPLEFKPPQRLLAWLQRVFAHCSTV